MLQKHYLSSLSKRSSPPRLSSTTKWKRTREWELKTSCRSLSMISSTWRTTWSRLLRLRRTIKMCWRKLLLSIFIIGFWNATFIRGSRCCRGHLGLIISELSYKLMRRALSRRLISLLRCMIRSWIRIMCCFCFRFITILRVFKDAVKDYNWNKNYWTTISKEEKKIRFWKYARVQWRVEQSQLAIYGSKLWHTSESLRETIARFIWKKP